MERSLHNNFWAANVVNPTEPISERSYNVLINEAKIVSSKRQAFPNVGRPSKTLCFMKSNFLFCYKIYFFLGIPSKKNFQGFASHFIWRILFKTVANNEKTVYNFNADFSAVFFYQSKFFFSFRVAEILL